MKTNVINAVFDFMDLEVDRSAANKLIVRIYL